MGASLDGNRIPTNQELIKHMNKTWPNYTRHSLYDDKIAIKSGSTFIHDLSLYSFSAYIEDIFNKIELIEREAMKDFNDSSGFVKVNSKKIVLDAQKVKADILTGQTINISVELLAKNMRKLQEQNKKLTEAKYLKTK